MKLLQVNIEGRKHIERILPFIDNQNPDVICLQEVDELMINALEARHYTVTFLPYLLRDNNGANSPEGIALAAKKMGAIRSHYYHPVTNIALQNHARYRETTALGYILADCVVDDVTYTIGTTHFTWTPRGDTACASQKEDMANLLNAIADEPPHILCGDFNIPRHQNELYTTLLAHYQDDIPPQYTSSLDKNHHRLGGVLSRSHLFTHYMVDYIFSKPQYRVSDVSLHFGLSDHAAVIATIENLKGVSDFFDHTTTDTNATILRCRV